MKCLHNLAANETNKNTAEVNQSINQSVNQSINQSISQSVNQSINNYLSDRPQVSMVCRLANHAGCWLNTPRIRS